MSRAEPPILAVAPNGARRTRADHPALPLTPGELAATAAACRDAGAALLHLHVRDDSGRHTLDPGRYREALTAVGEAVGDGLILQVSTEAAGRYAPPEQRALVRALRPEAVSLALSELVPEGADERAAGRFFAWIADTDILPQYILYSAAEVRRYHVLRGAGTIPAARASLLFVLGSRSRDAVPGALAPFLAAHPGPEPWMVCAFGRREQECLLAGAARGGDCRTGFENNCQLADGSLAADNAALVAQLAAAVRAGGRQPADAATARRLLGGV